ncbi:MAG: hypothetical protein GXP62_03475 [Oligoflexia bacterium]|nr:hypothetical protein [Oligoflexia bacterium]
MAWWLALLALLASACRTSTPGQQGPAHAYIAAAESGDPAACQAISDPDLRGECAVFAAHALALAGDSEQSRQVCAALPVGIWQDECWFSLSDALESTGKQAKLLCGLAGRFKTPCLGHVIARDSSRLLSQLSLGEESQALDQLRSLSIDYVGRGMGTARARQNMRKALAVRFRDQDFDPALCGSVPPDICADVYVELITFSAAHDGRLDDGSEDGPAKGRPAQGPSGSWRIRLVCEGSRSLAEVLAQGFVGWVPAGEALARQGWDKLCARRQQPHGRHGLGAADWGPPPAIP